MLWLAINGSRTARLLGLRALGMFITSGMPMQDVAGAHHGESVAVALWARNNEICSAIIGRRRGWGQGCSQPR
jgi:hypothetical protein